MKNGSRVYLSSFIIIMPNPPTQTQPNLEREIRFQAIVIFVQALELPKKYHYKIVSGFSNK